MITQAWFIGAIMSGIYADGTKDVFIFQHPKDHGHFHSSVMCQKFVGDNPFPIMKALISLVSLSTGVGPRKIFQGPLDSRKVFLLFHSF